MATEIKLDRKPVVGTALLNILEVAEYLRMHVFAEN